VSEILSEIIVLLALVRLGYRVAIPYGENNRYDFIVEASQITAGSSHVRRNGGQRPYLGDIDLFGVYRPEVEQVFLVPVDHVTRTQGGLRWEKTKNQQRRKISWANRYQLPSVAKICW
jgi:hypothetical protein